MHATEQHGRRRNSWCVTLSPADKLSTAGPTLTSRHSAVETLLHRLIAKAHCVFKLDRNSYGSIEIPNSESAYYATVFSITCILNTNLKRTHRICTNVHVQLFLDCIEDTIKMIISYRTHDVSVSYICVTGVKKSRRGTQFVTDLLITRFLCIVYNTNQNVRVYIYIYCIYVLTRCHLK